MIQTAITERYPRALRWMIHKYQEERSVSEQRYKFLYEIYFCSPYWGQGYRTTSEFCDQNLQDYFPHNGVWLSHGTRTVASFFTYVIDHDRIIKSKESLGESTRKYNESTRRKNDPQELEIKIVTDFNNARVSMELVIHVRHVHFLLL